MVEPAPLHPVARLLSIHAETESLSCTGHEADLVSCKLGDHPVPSAELCSENGKKNVNLNMTLMFCATEEELLTCNMGDSDSNQCKSLATRSTIAGEKVSIQAHDFSPSLRAKLLIEDPLLTTLADKPYHRLASLKHFEEYSSTTAPFLETLGSLESANSPKRFTYGSSTIPNMSSTILFDELHLSTTTTTTAGMKCTRMEQHTGRRKCGTPSADRLFAAESLDGRPRVPSGLLPKESSDAYDPAYPSEFLVADQNPGCTSTTHEVRWTQAEQDTLQTDGTTGPSIPVPNTRVSLVGHYADDSWHALHALHPTNVPDLAPCLENTEPEIAFLLPPNYQACSNTLSPNVSRPNVYRSFTDGPSSPFDHSLPIPTDVPNLTQTLNDCSWLGEPTCPATHYVAIPERCSSSSTLECDKDGPTSLLVQQSLTRHTTVCPFTCSYSPVTSVTEVRPTCARCEAQLNARKMTKQRGTQTITAPDFMVTPNRSTGPQLTHMTPCLSTSAPVGSEPPSMRVHVKFEANGTYLIQTVIPGAESTGMTTSALLRSVLTPSDNEIRPEKLAPLRVRQLPRKPVTHFEPFEKLQSASTHASKSSKSKRSNKMKNLDINMLNGSVTDIASSTGECEGNLIDLSKLFCCTYVEVSLKRNLQSVAPPSCLTDVDARMVHTLLEHKLQNAVATKFMSSSVKSKPSDTSSLSSTYPPPLNESGDVRSATNFTDSSTHRTLMDPAVKKRPREFKSFLVRVGNIYKYLPIRTVSKTRACGGVYMFTSGPRHVRPPKPWWDHIQKEQRLCNHSSVAAWKIDTLRLVVGGLLNHDCHLHVLVSSNDGRLGVVYDHGIGLLAELVQKGTRYASNQTAGSSTRKSENSCIQDSVRMHFRAPILARLIDSEMHDVSSVVGLNDLGLGVSLTSKRGNMKFSKTVDTITLYTMSEQFIPDLQQVRKLLIGVRRLRELSMELARSAHQLKRLVMPVESMDYLLHLLRKRASKLFVTSNEFLSRDFGKALRSVYTSYHGSLAHCIRGNAYCPKEHHPRATDPDAFNVFRELLDPILGNFALCLNARSQPLSNYEIPNIARPKADSRYLLRYRVRFARNLAGFGFPPVMSRRDFESVEQLCKDALLSWKEEGLGCWYRLCEFEEQNPSLFKNLQRKQLLMPTQNAVRQSSGTARFWPQGRSVYLAPKNYSNCDLVAQINGDDHLRVLCIDWTGKQPYLAYSRATKLMSWLDSRLQFSRSAQWGFLSPSLRNVGTGMQLSGWLRMNTLEHNVASIERLCTRYRLQVCSTCPHGLTSHYRLLDVAPISTLGRTEAEVMLCFMESMQRVCRWYEKSVRD